MTLGDNVQLSSAVNNNKNNTEDTNKQPSSLLCNGTSPGPETASPRKCLSLRKRTRSSSIPMESSADQQNEPCTLNHAPPTPNLATHATNHSLVSDQPTSAKEKNLSECRTTVKMVRSQEQEGPQGFVLGLGNKESREEEVDDDSQREMNITIAGDSQFETSEESQFLLALERPNNIDPNTSAVSEHVHRSSPTAPQGSIFSNVGASRRISRAVGSLHTNEGRTRDRDPFEFDSQSHGTPVEFMPRKRRNDGGVNKNCEDVGVRRGEDMGGQDSENEGVQLVRGETVHTEADEDLRERIAISNGEIVTSVMCEEVERGDGERPEGTGASQEDRYTSGESYPSSRDTATQVATETVAISTLSQPTNLSHSTHPHYSTPSHPPPVIVGSIPSTLHTITSHNSHITTSPFSTPPQFSFTSPSSRVSHHEICDGSSQYRARGERYAVRHVQTYHHSVKIKVVSQVIYEGDRVVDGLNTVWQVSSL